MSQQGTTRSYADAQTRTIAAAGATFAYRELGPQSGVPLVLLTHLGANLDGWDPRIVDGLAQDHRVIAVDYRGAFPVVYVIVRSQVVDTIALDDVTVPIYPMLYGNPTVTPSGSAETINFGATPFHYVPATVLAGAGIDITGFKSGWGG